MTMTKIKFETKSALGIMTLDNPPVNAIGIELIDELQDALKKIESSNIRGLIFKAEDLTDKAEKYMQNLADNGPILSFAATKKIISRFENEGIASADQMTQDLGSAMFDTNDFQNGVASFLKEGPGKINFKGK